MGFYGASGETMDNLRRYIDRDPESFKKKVAILPRQNRFALEGEAYKRLLRPSLEEPLLSWYQRKNVYLVRNSEEPGRLFAPEYLKIFAAGSCGFNPFMLFSGK